MGKISILHAVAAILAFFGAAMAQPVPLVDGGVVAGAQSCAGSTCHSRLAATGPTVQQNEMLIWQDSRKSSGAHSRAYDLLNSPRSQSIARLAGFGNAASAPECLSCHSFNVAEERHGDRFALSEGVTCEACHGSSGGWLTSHYATDASHQNNLANGLYPTDMPVKRAEMCVDCHIGSDRPDQFVTHTIMGAGHPRMSFELELFTAIQQHHTVDADYIARKGKPNNIRSWAIGQTVAMERIASLFADDGLAQPGLFPELVFFDCHACHQTISNADDAQSNWRANPARPLGPGVPVFMDANLIMLMAAVEEVAPEHLSSLQRAGTSLHASINADRPIARAAALELAAQSKQLRDVFEGTPFTTQQSLGILNRILDSTLTAQYTNYAAGEQAVIAIEDFLLAMTADGSISPAFVERLQPRIDTAFEAVAEPNTYNPAKLRTALSSIATALDQL